MVNTLQSFILNEEGAIAAEYAILAGLIAGVIVLAVTTFGLTVDDLFQQVADIFP
jgi:Flp pilus assembly pilin Flp